MINKKNIIFLSLLIFLLTMLILLKIMPFGSMIYKDKDILIEVPNISINSRKECLSKNDNGDCNYRITFKSFNSKYLLEMELNRITSKFTKKLCNNKDTFYDENHNITITNYKINKGILINEFYIEFHRGIDDSNKCSIIKDYKEITYSIYKPSFDSEGIAGCYNEHQFNYLNENGNIYPVYYDCFGDIMITTGTGVKQPFINFLRFSWLSMNDMINFLEYQVNQKKATKTIYEDNQIILYKNKDFSLLKCNTHDNNQSIYINGSEFKYDGNYCQ